MVDNQHCGASADELDVEMAAWKMALVVGAKVAAVVDALLQELAEVVGSNQQ